MEDGIFYYTYKPGTIVDLKDSMDFFEARMSLKTDRPYPCVGDCRNVLYWTEESRKKGNDPRFLVNYIAIAIIIKSSVQALIMNFYLKMTRVPVPIKLFTDEEKAVAWAKRFIITEEVADNNSANN